MPRPNDKKPDPDKPDKCVKLRYSIDFIKKKNYVCNYIHLLISYFLCCKYQTFIIKTERAYCAEKATKAKSDTIIIGILGICPVYPG